MLFSTWLRNWKRSLERRSALKQTRRRRPPVRRVAARPRLEALEDRTLLSPYIVTTTADSGAGSLRDAITQVNADTSHALYASPSNPNVDEIDFNIPTTDPGYNATTGAFTIKPLSALPVITNSVIIDGYTQPGASPNTLAQGDNAVLKIDLDGSQAAHPSTQDIAGLTFEAGNSTVTGLAVGNFNTNPGDDGILLIGGTNDIIAGNFIGTDVTGTIAQGNSFGIRQPSYSQIGGTTPGARNIISGNATGVDGGLGGLVEGNYIGTDISGKKALGNQTGVLIYEDSYSTIAGNLISGNTDGIEFTDTPGNVGDVIEGNYIGTDVTGTTATGTDGKSLGNQVGIQIGSADNLVIGGISAGAGNLISGNGIGINFGFANSVTVQGNLIGTDATGTKPLGNSIGLNVGAAYRNYLIGGTTAGSRNIISGNYTGIVEDGGAAIEGNFIGTDVTGTQSVGNANAGIVLHGSGQTIGGTAPGAGNLISGNGFGIRSDNPQASNNLIQGNLIGTDVTGTRMLSNSNWGIWVAGSNNTIGGTVPGARNIISGNGLPSGNAGDILIDGSPSALASGNVVQGNYIGTDITGTKALGLGGLVGVFLGNYASDNLVGGTTAAARNIISGMSAGYPPNNLVGSGIYAAGSGDVIEGNYVGTDVTGSHALPNDWGIFVAASETIGGTASGAGNLISGNNYAGVQVGYHNYYYGTHETTGAVLEGNLIGTDASGTQPLGNGTNGVGIYGSGNTVGGLAAGAANTIAFNGGSGVFVELGTGNSILSNSIHDNGGLGIYLNSANNANDNQTAPVLTSTSSSSSGTTVSGTLASVPNTTFRIEFFANQSPDPSGSGEGQTFLGYLNVTTDANGNATFTAMLPALPAGQTILSATATNLTTSDTSQFSRDVSIPTVGPITAPLTPVAINTTINASASFTDAIASTTHTAVWNWGDGTTSSGAVTESNGSGTVTGSHAYTVDGVYTVTLTVTNNLGGSGQSVFSYVVVYNPSAGFTTGGGWFNSPAGADTANPTLTGQANFGFNAKYQSGSTVPTGQTEFQFPAANLNFQSTSYDWLVLNGSQAQFQGSGTINGSGNYGFLVTVADNDASSGGGADTIRIQIWDKNNNNTVVYDTQPGAAITATPTTPLGGGDIQVHANTTKMATVVLTNGGTTTSGASQPAPVTGSSDSSSTPTPVATSTPASSASSVSSNTGSWLTLETSAFDSLERDLSQWEAAMMQELASVTQIVDQLFADWDRTVLDSFGAIRH